MKYSSDWTECHTPHWLNIFSEFISPNRTSSINFLEIGCFEGQSSVWFVKNVLHEPNDRLYCVDIFHVPYHDSKRIEFAFDKSIALYGQSKVTKIKERSITALSKFEDNFFDIIYIDGDHEAGSVLCDAIQSLRICKHGGIMLFDDYHMPMLENMIHPTKKGIDYFLELYSHEVEIIHSGYQLGVRKNG